MYKIRMSVPRAHLNRTDWLNLISLKLPFGRSLRILPVSIQIVQSEMSTRTMLGVFAALPASPSNSYNLIPTHWSNLGLLAKTHWLPSKRVSKRYQNFSDSINGSASNTVKYHTIYKKSATIIFLISQFLDVQYYDARISLMFWILLAGIKCISEERRLTCE